MTNFHHKRPCCLYRRELLVWRCHEKKNNEPCLKWRLSRLFLTRKFVLSVPESFPIVSIFPWSTESKLMEGSTQGGFLVVAERHLGVRRRYRPSEDGENKTPFNTAEKHSFRVNEAQNTRMLSLQKRLQPSEHGTSIKYMLYNNQLHVHSSTATNSHSVANAHRIMFWLQHHMPLRTLDTSILII